MKFYEALKYLLTTSGSSKIARKSWTSNTYLIKSKIIVNDQDTKTTIPSIDFVEIIGGTEHKCTFHANPNNMLAEDWYIVE